MKNLIPVLLLLILPLLMPAQTRSINQFYNKYKHGKEVMNFTIPGWVIRLGTSIARKHVDDPKEKAAIDLARKVRKMKLLVMEEQNNVSPKDIQKLIDNVKKRDNYEELIYVRDKGTRVNMLIRNKHDIIENMLILVSEENEFVMVSLNTRLRFEDINELLRTLSEEMDFDLDFDPEEEETVPVVRKEPQV